MPKSAREALEGEHERLRAAVSRLREALSGADGRSPEIAEALSRLADELFQHEASEAWRVLAGARFEGEHLSLRSLARDLRTVWDDPQAYPFPHAARLAMTLADGVSAHLDLEAAELLR
ncbi:MAG: hypothetical protein FD126_3710 [Elusimicrobia bacterium]|nr:MAG: hypothetical protein FD126_3710 [Elusimicrobiota bacterium]